jgi:hypothetical protein
MKCETAKEQLMDYLFSELDEAAGKEMEVHLKDCKTCAQELEEHKNTVDLLEKWPEIEPKHKLVFAGPAMGFFHRLKEYWMPSAGRSRWLIWGARLAVAAVVIALLLLRADLRYGNGQLALTIGSESGTEAAKLPSDLAAAVKQLQEQNLYLTSQLIQASEDRQTRLVLTGLAELSDKIDQQRYTDLRYVGESLSHIDRKNEYNFDRTNSILQGLVRVTGTELPEIRR